MAMGHDKSPIDQALDVAVFGPLGLVLTAKDALPGWVDKGRGSLVHQVKIARLIGEQAARYGQKMATDTLVGFGILPGPPPPAQPARATRPPGTPGSFPGPGDYHGARPVDPDAVAPSGNGRRRGPLDRATATSAAASPSVPALVPGSAELAIPGYDSLSASQVVQRLAGLAAGELEAVRTYEAAGRGRRTILTKISQLQTGRP
jgi:hypothetical protein